MPLLGVLVYAFFEKFFGAWADTLTRKLAIITGAITAITALTTGLVALVSGMVNAVIPALPPMIGTGIWLFVPYNAPVCLGIIFAVDAACAVFIWAKANIVLAAKVAA